MANWNEKRERYAKTVEFREGAMELLNKMKDASPEEREKIELQLQTMGRSFDLPEPEVNTYYNNDPIFSKALRLTALLELAESENANYLTLRFLKKELENLEKLDKNEVNEILKQTNELRAAASRNASGKGTGNSVFDELRAKIKGDSAPSQPGE